MKENEKKQEQKVIEKDNPTCGIIMPISSIDTCSKEHWEEVKKILSEAISSANFNPCLVSDADDSGVIQKRIVQNIYDNDIIVCDVSCKNPNVMFELGMRLAFDKPTIIVMDDSTNYSFDTSVIEHLIYPRNLSYYAILDFQKKLTGKLTATISKSKDDPNYTTFLKHFGEFEVAHIEKKKGSVNDVLLSKMEELSCQINAMRNVVTYARLDTNERKRMLMPIIKEEIRQYYRKNNIDEKRFVCDQNEFRKIVMYLWNNNMNIRTQCGTISFLRGLVEDIVNPLPF